MSNTKKPDTTGTMIPPSQRLQNCLSPAMRRRIMNSNEHLKGGVWWPPIASEGKVEEPQYYIPPTDGWTCFHCGEKFTTVGSARLHFGDTPLSTPGCIIKAGEEMSLLMVYRKLESRFKAVFDVNSGHPYPHVEQIVDVRTKLGLSQEECAELLDIGLPLYRQYEEGWTDMSRVLWNYMLARLEIIEQNKEIGR